MTAFTTMVLPRFNPGNSYRNKTRQSDALSDNMYSMAITKKRSSPLQLTPQPITRNKISERTRTAILNAALDFLWSRPFREMTVNELMASTSVGRSAFYQYFNDLHDVMESLLKVLQEEVLNVDEPWFMGVGDPVELLRETLSGLVDVCYKRGPFLRAITDAATTDARIEEAWMDFLSSFDDAVTPVIEADQKRGLIPAFDVYPVSFALNRLNAYTLTHAFGQHPRKPKEPVLEALERIWISTLYGSESLGINSTPLVRK
jgi:AcrR family transcriptional regulator